MFYLVLKNKYPPLALHKRYKMILFSCHTCPLPLLWHEFDNCLCNFLQSKVSCCLHMYFLWRHHLPPDKSANDQDSDSDWFTILCNISNPTMRTGLDSKSAHAIWIKMRRLEIWSSLNWRIWNWWHLIRINHYLINQSKDWINFDPLPGVSDAWAIDKSRTRC
jgi:hypothetical protein